MIIIFLLFILDLLLITYLSLTIFNAILFLKIKRIYKKNTYKFLNNIKRDYDYSYNTPFISCYASIILILTIIYLLFRFSIFYLFQSKIHPFYSIYLVYLLLIPLSFYYGLKTNIKSIQGIQNTVAIGKYDIPTGPIIFGLLSFFSFREKSSFYTFLKSAVIIITKIKIIMNLIAIPVIIVIGIILLIYGQFKTSYVLIMGAIICLSFLYLFKRNLKFTRFTIFLILFILIGSILYNLFFTLTSFVYFTIILIVIIIFFYIFDKYKGKK